MKSTITFLFAVLLLLVSCKNSTNKEIKTEPIRFTKEGELTISRMQTDSVLVKLDIEIAETEYETQTGLMYRDSMSDNQGMLFIFSDNSARSFYMKNTEIPLDIIYINESNEIVSFQKNAKPFDETGLPSQVPAKYVLEINAGLSDKWGIGTGDRINFSRN